MIIMTPTNGTLMKSIMDGWMADWRIRALMITSARTRSIRCYYYYQALLLSSEMSLGLIMRLGLVFFMNDGNLVDRISNLQTLMKRRELIVEQYHGLLDSHVHTHTHTHIYIYIYIDEPTKNGAASENTHTTAVVNSDCERSEGTFLFSTESQASHKLLVWR
uniref:Bm10706, isoform b n=1 Tax=Brugia malayi TaxID=6279 RepID=A0A1I9G1N4_BRUMA|nr:Bm10706, isoform b [Brugia malayi]